ncbi:MAG: glycosyltransferase family 1 protein [Cyanobacteria bacterium J06633_8]
MKVAVKFSPPMDYKGGSRRTFATNLIKSLYEKNQDISLFTQSSALFSDIHGLSIHHAENPFFQKSSFKKITSWLHQQANFENELLKHHIDVLYCPYNPEALYNTRKIPQIITVHDLIPVIWKDDFKITSTLWKYIYIPTINNATAVITVSENTKKDILNFCNISSDKVFVVPNGFSAFEDSQETAVTSVVKPYILCVCSVHYPHKNLIKLIESYHSISSSFPHKLVIVGRTVPRFTPEIKSKISVLGLSEKIVLLENLSNKELAGIYKNADLFVYPSIYEGFGIPPLEAMFHGTPVVASNATSMPEVCGDAVLYFNPQSVESIAEGITKSLSNFELRQKLILAGRERLKKFSWEKTAAGILEVCQMVCK